MITGPRDHRYGFGERTAANRAFRPRLLESAWSERDQLPVLLGLVMLGAAGTIALTTLGLPPLDLHGPLHRMWGIMDPLCGGTRAVYWLGRGRLDLAWRYNPGVFALAGWAALVYTRTFYGLLSGRWLRLRWRRGVLLALLLGGAAILEVNQQLHAALLMRP